MSRLPSLLIAATAGAIACTSIAHGGEFFDLGASSIYASDASADGSVVVGSNFSEYWYWTESTGLVFIGGTAAGNGVGGQAKVSDDGNYICGTFLNPASGAHELSIYSIADGTWTPLGGIGGQSGTEISSGWGISGDGNHVVGLGWLSAGGAHAIQWSAGVGTFDLGSTVPDRSTRANAVNGDGTVVGGWQDSSSGFRQGAVWVDGVQTLVWNDAGMTQRAGEVNDLSADGTWAVGFGVSSNAWQGYRWSAATGAQHFGTYPGQPTWRGFATGVSADGARVVGGYRPFPGPATFGEGYLWTEADGIVPLATLAAAQSIDLQGQILALPLGISSDGSTIVGATRTGRGFVLRLDLPSAPCDADFDGSGAVDFNDLLAVLSAWGPCAGCPEDLDGSGDVGFDDLLLLLSAYGPCP